MRYEACLITLYKHYTNAKAVLHQTHKDDREQAAERPRIRLPHTKAPYVQSYIIHQEDTTLTVPVTYDQTSSKSPADKVPADPLVDLHPTLSLPVIVRASDGKTQSKDRVKNKDHVKISTIVQPDDLEGFFTRYADVCKASMLSLRKRDRRKRKADKGKKKKGTETAEKKG
jgi:signal recognition particle subunit SRP14